jgi:hypothetical protein
MRRVLLDSTVNPRLSRRAVKELGSFRAEPIADPTGTLLLETKGQTEWWTFAGFRGNAALTQSCPFPVSFDNLSIRTRASRVELRRAIETRQNLVFPQINRQNLPKFAECVPERLLGEFALLRNYDQRAANCILEKAIIYS